ncbi:MAG: efflux RND transporter periplasmic adaptor subunit [Acidobacteriota bacterium]
MSSDRVDDIAQLRIDRNATRRRSWPAVAAVFVVVMAALAGWWLWPHPRSVRTALAVSAAVGGAPAAQQVTTASGYIVARRRASVGARISGMLVELSVEEGSVVEKGEVIARIDDLDLQAQLQASRADHGQSQADLREAMALRAEAERDLELQRRLFARDAASKEAVRQARSAVDVARASEDSASSRVETAAAQIATLEARLDKTIVRAPFSGTVLTKDAEIGEVVAPAVASGQSTRGAIATIADLDSLEAEVDVNQRYIAQLIEEQPAEVKVDAYPERVWRGHLRQILPSADRQRGTVLVRVAIDDDKSGLLPDLATTVTFLSLAGAAAQEAPGAQAGTAGGETPRAEVPVVLVPAEAVVPGPTGPRVALLQEGGAVIWRAVQTRHARDGKVEIVSGLNGGETVIVAPPPDLRDGERVRTTGQGTR